MEKNVFEICAKVTRKVGAFVDNIYSMYRLMKIELFQSLYSKDFKIEPFQEKLTSFSSSFEKLELAINLGVEMLNLWQATSLMVDASELCAELHTLLAPFREAGYYQLNLLRLAQRFILPHKAEQAFALQAHIHLFGLEFPKLEHSLTAINHLRSSTVCLSQTLKSVTKSRTMVANVEDEGDASDDCFFKSITKRIQKAHDEESEGNAAAFLVNQDEPDLKIKNWNFFPSSNSAYPSPENVVNILTKGHNSKIDLRCRTRQIFFGTKIPWIETDALFVKDELILKRHCLCLVQEKIQAANVDGELVHSLSELTIKSSLQLTSRPPHAPLKKTLSQYEGTFDSTKPKVPATPSQKNKNYLQIYCDSAANGSKAPSKRATRSRAKQANTPLGAEDPIEIGASDLPHNVRLAMYREREKQADLHRVQMRSLKNYSNLLPEAYDARDLLPKVLSLYNRLSIIPNATLLRPVCHWLALHSLHDECHERAASFLSHSIGVTCSNLYLSLLSNLIQKYPNKLDSYDQTLVQTCLPQMLLLSAPFEVAKVFSHREEDFRIDSSYLASCSSLRFMQLTLVDELDACYRPDGNLSLGLPRPQGLGSRENGLLLVTLWRLDTQTNPPRLVTETRHLENFLKLDGLQLIGEFQDLLAQNNSLMSETDRKKYWYGRYRADLKMQVSSSFLSCSFK
ncbi:Separin [Cichlidogyrus casuarinus]|uniref:Separin n=1 Tax=Cichlidogyrus casuarinus TaxID=1844966 RepID=A0ABD2QD91_9PLAT